MNSRRSSKYESFDDSNERPPPFKRLPQRNAQPLPGTIIVSCGVCSVIYQKRLDCEFFQCENCHALVTHSTNGFMPTPPNISVVVNNQAPKTKKKKKKKKSRTNSSSSSDTNSSSSSSLESSRKKKRQSRKVKELEKQVKELQRKGGYAGTTGDDWPQQWPQVWPDSTPVSPTSPWGAAPQLMDSPYRSNSEPWSPWSGGSSQSGSYANQSMNKALAVTNGESFGNSKWGGWPSPSGNSNMPNSPSSWGTPPSNSWVSPQSPAQNSMRPPSNLFGNCFGQAPQITVNVPPDIASLSSDQLMLLANAKRYAEEQNQKQQPFNLQIMPNKDRRSP